MNALPFLDQMLSYALLAVTLLGYFVLGFAIDASMFLSLLMGAWLAVYAAVRWWMFIFPQAKHALHQPWRLLYELKLMLFSAMGFLSQGGEAWRRPLWRES